MSPAASDSDFDEDEDPDKIEVPGNLFYTFTSKISTYLIFLGL